MNLSLRWRITLAFCLLAAGATAAMAVAFAILGKRHVDQTTQQDSAQASALLTNLIRDRTLSLRSETQVVAGTPMLKALVLRPYVDEATVDDVAQENLRRMRADALILTNRDGRIIGQSGLRARANEIPGIQAALRMETWSGVVATPTKLMLATTMPILNGDYVIGTATSMSALDNRTAEDLETVLQTPFVFVAAHRVVGSSTPVTDTWRQLPTYPRSIDLNGRRYVAMYSQLPHTSAAQQIGFITLIDYDEAVKPLRQFELALVAVLLLVAVAGAFAAHIVARSITSPLEGVVQAAGSICRGVWPEPVAIKSTGEAAVLQDAFNQMVASVRENQQKLLAMIDIDPLTELDNHRRFLERLGQELARAQETDSPLSMVLIDFDGFKAFNDEFGPAGGDAALAKGAAILRGWAPAYATLGRLSGKDFAVLLSDCEIDEALAAAEELREKFKTAFADETLTVSIGCAQSHLEPKPSSLVLACEIALSTAKQLGRDRVSAFDSSQGPADDPRQLNDFASEASLATIQALAAAVDAKDPYSAGHSLRVAEYAADLARYVGASEERVALVHRTGTLHDVGKIGIPDAILTKPTRLTHEELIVMQTHPALGEVIVRKVPGLADTLEGVRYHHERWDGRGYPDGLVGEQIPWQARVLAIADTFDAMTTDRPYRKSCSWEESLREIEQCAGKQFESSLALSFARMMRRRMMSEAA
ncbi:MAG: diguanylate cyclase [Fimbriimonas ginsengisoli]|uniref:Diguanylate cyclase n=1 Tax=Fimbriimonas ginsengisoli TaxID=1005039 RepID=A0A931PUN5_FIMGI|nr:diguanylate cyclase [Fimbriimonas ginsengisoli]